MLRVFFPRFPLKEEQSMQRIWMPSIALAAAVAGVLVAAEVQSGLKPGEHAGAFNVKDITGPNKGKSLCYR
jgi:hypothetical protein